MIGKLPDGNSALDEYKPFATVDFIVTDLDGTLTIGSKPVLEQIKNKIAYLRRLGVNTTIATGRTYVGARILIDELHIEDGMPIALYNGGVLVEHNRDNIIAMCTIPFYAVQSILNLIGGDRAGIYIYTYDISGNDFRDLLNVNYIKENVYYTGQRKVLVDVNGTQVCKVDMNQIREKNVVSILLQRNELTFEDVERLYAAFNDDKNVDFTDSGSGFIEIKGAAQNKSIIITELKKRERSIKYSADKILAIGDNDNDSDLLEAADISVAVANSSEKAINKADYVCENENANGFLDMLTVIERAKHFFGS